MFLAFHPESCLLIPGLQRLGTCRNDYTIATIASTMFNTILGKETEWMFRCRTFIITSENIVFFLSLFCHR